MNATSGSPKGEGMDSPSNEHAACSGPRLATKLALATMIKFTGELSEWLKEHAWKVCIR